MVVRPQRVLSITTQLANQVVRQLGAESQRVNDVAEGVAAGNGRAPPLRQVVDVHVAVGEGPTGRNVEVANHLVDAQAAFDAAAFVALLGQPLRVVLPLALLHGGAIAKGPRGLGVGFAHFFAGGAAAGLFGVVRGRGAVAGTAVGGVEVGGGFVGGVAVGCKMC